MFGFGAVAQPVFDPDTINFGTCIDLTQNYFQTTVTDTGDYPLDICSLDIVGPDSSEFSLVRPPTLPYTVPDSDRGSLTLGFNFTTNAHTGGIHHATLIIHYCNGSVDSLPMLGREATASVFINSLPINFGKVRVGHTQDTAVGFGNPEDIAEQIDTLRIDPLPPPAIPFSSKDLPLLFRQMARAIISIPSHLHRSPEGSIPDKALRRRRRYERRFHYDHWNRGTIGTPALNSPDEFG